MIPLVSHRIRIHLAPNSVCTERCLALVQLLPLFARWGMLRANLAAWPTTSRMIALDGSVDPCAFCGACSSDSWRHMAQCPMLWCLVHDGIIVAPPVGLSGFLPFLLGSPRGLASLSVATSLYDAVRHASVLRPAESSSSGSRFVIGAWRRLRSRGSRWDVDFDFEVDPVVRLTL